ncbi:MAG: hypothetical protein ABH851_03140 [Methanobacteriota archaeon]
MRFLRIMREGFSVYSHNLTTFLLAMIIAVCLSVFILTIPPLIFGLYYMGYKASKMGSVSLTDLFQGFRLTVKSWIYFLVITVIVISVPSILHVILDYLNMSDIPAFIIVSLIFIFWSTLNFFCLVYAIPQIVGEGKGVFPAIKDSIRLVYDKFSTTIMVFISLTIITVLIGWIPVFGPLVVIPYQIITYSRAVIELSD